MQKITVLAGFLNGLDGKMRSDCSLNILEIEVKYPLAQFNAVGEKRVK